MLILKLQGENMKKSLQNMPYYLVRLQNEEEIVFLTKFLKMAGYKIALNGLTSGKRPVMIKTDKLEAFNATDIMMASLCATFSRNVVEENILSLEDFIKKIYNNKINKKQEKTF